MPASRIIQLCSSGLKNIDKDLLTDTLDSLNINIDESYFKLDGSLIGGARMKARMGAYQYQHQDKTVMIHYDHFLRIPVSMQPQGFFFPGHLSHTMKNQPGEEFDAMFRYRSVASEEGPTYVGVNNLGQIQFQGDKLRHTLHQPGDPICCISPITLPTSDEQPG